MGKIEIKTKTGQNLHNFYERNFRAVMELNDFSVRLMEDNIRRRNPDYNQQQIAQQLSQWLNDRPGAKFGDGPNPPMTRVGFVSK